MTRICDSLSMPCGGCADVGVYGAIKATATIGKNLKRIATSNVVATLPAQRDDRMKIRLLFGEIQSLGESLAAQRSGRRARGRPFGLGAPPGRDLGRRVVRIFVQAPGEARLGAGTALCP